MGVLSHSRWVVVAAAIRLCSLLCVNSFRGNRAHTYTSVQQQFTGKCVWKGGCLCTHTRQPWIHEKKQASRSLCVPVVSSRRRRLSSRTRSLHGKWLAQVMWNCCCQWSILVPSASTSTTTLFVPSNQLMGSTYNNNTRTRITSKVDNTWYCFATLQYSCCWWHKHHHQHPKMITKTILSIC